jgi:hypothetical protein
MIVAIEDGTVSLPAGRIRARTVDSCAVGGRSARNHPPLPYRVPDLFLLPGRRSNRRSACTADAPPPDERQRQQARAGRAWVRSMSCTTAPTTWLAANSSTRTGKKYPGPYPIGVISGRGLMRNSRTELGASVGPFAASHGILPRYAACSADDHAGVGVAAATGMAGAAAWVGTAARMARPGRLAAAPGRLGVLGAGRLAAAPATAAAASAAAAAGTATSPAAAAGAATPPATAAAPPAIAAAAAPPATAAAAPPATAAAAPPVAAAAASTPAASRGAVQARPGARDLVRPDSVPRSGRHQCR